MSLDEKLKRIEAKIRLAKTKELIKLRAESTKRNKNIKKFLKKRFVYRRITKPSERLSVKLNVPENYLKKGSNFFQEEIDDEIERNMYIR